jgi:predicted GNAT family N-acyltransferase
MSEFQIKVVTTENDYQAVLKIRREVFVAEQGVPEELEIDENEKKATYFLLICSGQAMATGRIRVKDGILKFERVATLAQARGRGLGRALMKFMQEYGNLNFPDLPQVLNAQMSAITFYEKLGWIAEGPVFDEAGILHRKMRNAN